MKAQLLMEQLDLEEIKDIKMVEAFFSERKFKFSEGGEEIELIEQNGKTYLEHRMPKRHCEIEIWTTDAKERLKIVTGEVRNPNKWVSEFLTKEFNYEYEYRKIKTMLSKEELYYTSIKRDLIGFTYPFPIIPETFKEILPYLDEFGKMTIHRQESSFQDSVAAYFRELFEKNNKDVMIPYYEVPYEDEENRFFQMAFSPCNHEVVKRFKEMIEEKKGEVKNRYYGFRNISMTKNGLIRLVKENKNGLSEENQAFVMEKLRDIKTPFDKE